MKHLLGRDNLALLTTRQTTTEAFSHAMVTNLINEMKTCSHDRGTNCFPLFLIGEDGLVANEPTANFCPKQFSRFAGILSSPDLTESNALRLFEYIYAVLYSVNYRDRYAEFLRTEFPRIPIPLDSGFFTRMFQLGRQLIELHLLENLEIRDGAFEVFGNGPLVIEKATYESDTIYFNSRRTQGLRGIGSDVWTFDVGGYQPMQKWLKDRNAKSGKNPRPGRRLTSEDIEHYQKMVVAIRETIRLMGEIDEVIDQHGGWPDAFVTELLELKPDDKEHKLPFA